MPAQHARRQTLIRSRALISQATSCAVDIWTIKRQEADIVILESALRFVVVGNRQFLFNLLDFFRRVFSEEPLHVRREFVEDVAGYI